MSVEEILLDAEERMEKALAKLKQDLTGIRTGRANPGLVDSLRSRPTARRRRSSSSPASARRSRSRSSIRPFDPSTIKDIERAIIASDLGLAPQSDGKVIRLNIPPLSGDVRARRWSPASRSWPKRRRSRSATSAATATSRRPGREGRRADRGRTRSRPRRQIQELTKKYEGHRRRHGEEARRRGDGRGREQWVRGWGSGNHGASESVTELNESPNQS